MTITDKNNIKRLFYFHRYSKASISRLYGVSSTRIKTIIAENKDITFAPIDQCLICSSEEAKAYFIDGNEEHNIPQNIIMLCEMDKRRIEHLQIRRREGIIKGQY